MVPALLALALLGLAAWRDIATRSIPDSISLVLAGLGLLLRWHEGWAPLGLSLLAALGLFLILLTCHARGLLGGGDVKLLTALALGLPPLGSYQLVVATALAGGVLAIAYLVLHRALSARGGALSPRGRGEPLLRRIVSVEARRIRARGPLPYGVAIAVGGALVLLQSPGG